MRYPTFVSTAYLLICFIGFVSCKDDRPKGILSEDKMTAILIDIYLGEGKVTRLNLKRDSSLIVFKLYEQKIYEKHQVDREAYEKSMSYYYDHPDEMEVIYDAVMDSLNMKEQQLKEAREAGKEKMKDKQEADEEQVELNLNSND